MPVSPSKSGDLLGERYLLEYRLPDAGLGEAWTARDRQQSDAPVIVKLLGVGATGDIQDPRSLPALVTRMKRVECPDVAAPHAWGDQDDRLFVVLPRFEGRSLSGWIAGHRKARTRPALATAQRLVDRIAGALDAARIEGSTAPSHGALSPRSVLMRREAPGRYDLRVLDFGVAPLVVPSSGEHPLDAMSRAPEQSPWTPETESPRTDVFALAALMAEVLGTTQPTPTAWTTLSDDPAKLRARLASLRSDVPHVIWDLVARSLSADPSQRPANPGELRVSLQSAWKKLGLWEKAALTPEPEPPEVPPSAEAPTEVPRTLFGPPRPTRSEAPSPAPQPTPAPPPAMQPPTAMPVASAMPAMPALPALPAMPAAPIALPIAGPTPLAAPIALPIAGPAPLAPLPPAAPAFAAPSVPAFAPPAPPEPMMQHALETLPIAAPALAPPIAPRGMHGLGASALGSSPRPSTLAGVALPPPPKYDDTPTMLPGQMNPYATGARPLFAPPPEPPAQTLRSIPPLAVESTSLDVHLPLADSPEETTGEDPPAFEDPSPTPPDGMPAMLASNDLPPPSPRPSESRLRGRTIGHEEAASLSLASVTVEPEGTQMMQFDRSSLSDAPRPLAPGEMSGDPFASSPFDAAPRTAPIVERTLAIDLSAVGASPDLLAPPQSTLTAPLRFTQPPQTWGAAPLQPPAMPTPEASNHRIWWVLLAVAVVVILIVAVVATKR